MRFTFNGEKFDVRFTYTLVKLKLDMDMLKKFINGRLDGGNIKIYAGKEAVSNATNKKLGLHESTNFAEQFTTHCKIYKLIPSANDNDKFRRQLIAYKHADRSRQDSLHKSVGRRVSLAYALRVVPEDLRTHTFANTVWEEYKRAHRR